MATKQSISVYANGEKLKVIADGQETILLAGQSQSFTFDRGLAIVVVSAKTEQPFSGGPSDPVAGTGAFESPTGGD